MSKIILLTLASLISGYNFLSTFDQSQTGDLNVQVDVKDVQIIALLKGGKEDYVDYDYAYDYSEMTIKPQNGTTPKPLNVSSTVSDTSEITTIRNNATLDDTTEPMALNNTSQKTTMETTQVPLSTNESVTTIRIETYTLKDKNSTALSNNSTDCKKGFVLNQKGDCELKLQHTGNALLKLVKLSQKLKLRRENRRGQAALV